MESASESLAVRWLVHIYDELQVRRVTVATKYLGNLQPVSAVLQLPRSSATVSCFLNCTNLVQLKLISDKKVMTIIYEKKKKRI